MRIMDSRPELGFGEAGVVGPVALQVRLWVGQSAFWHSREQYFALWHLPQRWRGEDGDASGLAQALHVEMVGWEDE